MSTTKGCVPQSFTVYCNGKEVCVYAFTKAEAIMSVLELYPEFEYHSINVLLTPQWKE
jgi:hypothetical protein